MCLFLTLDTGNNILQLFAVMTVFVLILVVAYFVTRWIGTNQGRNFFGKNIRVIEGCRIGTNKFIQIVKVGNKFLILGIGKDEISYLGEVEEQDLAITENGVKTLPDFKEILAKVKQKSFPTKKK